MGTTGVGQSDEPRSLLLIDCGAINTKVALAGLVEGQARLLGTASALTTVTPPRADISAGVREAVGALERVCGRRLLRGAELISPERDDGSGVDAVAVAASAGGPLRLLALGPGRESQASLIYRALGGLFTSMEMPGTGELTREPPHAVLLVGQAFGTQRGGDTLNRAVAHAVNVLEAQSASATAPIVFTGSPDDAAFVATALNGRRDALRAVDTLSPSSTSPLTRVVSDMHEAAVLEALPGFAQLKRYASNPAIAASASFGGTIRYLAHHYQMTVVGVDVGASSTVVAGATARGDFLPGSRSTCGVATGAAEVLNAAGIAAVGRWVSAPLRPGELEDVVFHRVIRPRLLPASELERDVEYALAREAIRLALGAPGSRVNGLHPMDVILGSGGVLAHVAHPADAALILLDGLQPYGVSSLVLDTAQLAAMLGSAAAIAPGMAATLAETDAVPVLLGSVVSVAGDAAPGQQVLHIVLEYLDGRQHAQDVLAGTLVRLPLAPGEQARLSLYPAPTIDIGLGPGQRARASEPVEGGVLGLLVDARGRPIRLAADTSQRAQQLLTWRRAIMGDGEQ